MDIASGRQDISPGSGQNVSSELSELEFAIINLSYGFARWVESCMAASGTRGLGATDILVLHAVNHRARGRRLAEICMVLNIDDTHLVAYSLKKLVAAGLAAVRRIGRESHYESTPKGDGICLAYRGIREEFLVTSVRWLTDGRPLSMLPETTLLLRTLTALYDQAGRSATAATSGPLPPPVRTKR
jgi:predicted MarR family transcription regulator